MAKQCGNVLYEGTMDNLTGYKMNGKYYFRKKSRVTREKVRRHRNYTNTMRNARCFGRAVQLAKQVYYEYRCRLPEFGFLFNKRIDLHKVWYPLRNRAQQLVRKHVPEPEIMEILRREFVVNMNPVMQSAITKRNRAESEERSINSGWHTNADVLNKLCDELAAYARLLKTLLPAKSASDPNETQQNFRIGAGIVYKPGK